MSSQGEENLRMVGKMHYYLIHQTINLIRKTEMPAVTFQWMLKRQRHSTYSLFSILLAQQILNDITEIAKCAPFTEILLILTSIRRDFCGDVLIFFFFGGGMCEILLVKNNTNKNSLFLNYFWKMKLFFFVHFLFNSSLPKVTPFVQAQSLWGFTVQLTLMSIKLHFEVQPSLGPTGFVL